jgi:tetratricopeptide (TPR) repeat protein
MNFQLFDLRGRNKHMTTLRREKGSPIKLLLKRIIFGNIPTHKEAYYSKLGTTYFISEEYRKAISAFNASEESHNHQDADFSKHNLRYIGGSYFNLGDFERAIDHFEKYLRLNPHDYKAISMIGLCYALMNKPEIAIKSYLRAAELEPDSPMLHVECSKILMELGRKEEALEHLEKAEIKTKGPTERGILKALWHNMQGDIQRAVSTLKAAILKIDSDSDYINPFQHENIHILLSRFQREAGNSNDVLSTLESALKIAPNDVWLMNEIAKEYADQNSRLKQALKLIDRALRYQPENPIFLDTRRRVLLKMGITEEGKRGQSAVTT